MPRTQELVKNLLAHPAPRPDSLARDAAARLFPTWQAILVGVPFALILGPAMGALLALVVALPVGLLLEPRPAWLGNLSDLLLLAGTVLGVCLVVLWLVRRRASFAALAREGMLFPTIDVAARGPGRIWGNELVVAAADSRG
ncbi:MAG: hypothetical protein QM765_43010 [Myxococcales bacterium]